MSKWKAVIPIVAILLIGVACSSGGGLNSECDSAIFIDHVILDTPVELGTIVMPGTHFTKTWRVQNDGDCTWTTDYDLVQVAGSSFSAVEEHPLAIEVDPGESVDISLSLTAPSESGSHRGEWMLRNAEGDTFGVAASGEAPLITEFQVADLAPGVVYEFDQVHCLAVWHSNLATFLPCDGGEDEEDPRIGYVRLVADASLEDNNPNNSSVIEVKPNNQDGGWINGIFPPITIHSGDHFLAEVGCLAENPDCSIIFQLEYQREDGSLSRLGEWQQLQDREASSINIDISELAGESIRFILRVEENGGRSLQGIGYWLDARIERAD